MKNFNPFRPGKVVAPGMFAGRWKHITELVQILNQTRNGNAQHFALIGERGIGKSSLLMLLKELARGFSIEGSDFNFLVVDLDLEPNTTYFDVVRRAGSGLQRVATAMRPKSTLAKSTWDFFKRWQVFGVKYDTSQPPMDVQELLDNLVEAVTETISALAGEIDGIVFLIDEADKPAATANVGEFCKLFTERLTRRNCNQVCIGLAGLPGLINKLKESHESSPRVFEVMTLEPLLPQDRATVIMRGIEEANSKNKTPTTISEGAVAHIVDLSEGYPHFIQQFAFCAFAEDSDHAIELDDVKASMDAAITQLGYSYFNDLYFEQIASDDYRAVLHAMAEHSDRWVRKEEIRIAARIKETQLTNALQVLKQRNIILAQDGMRGVYRLPSRAFAVWIKARTHTET